ncbi:MAG: sensor histidine kinase [Cryomorphaceae bacterium]|nr:sensor histidine kinase [Cryomorphaceae bacterium]
MLQSAIRYLMPQLVAFLFCSFQLYSQTACFSIEQKMNELAESNTSDYEVLIKDLKNCELVHQIEQDKSRLAYHQARIYVRKRNLDKADRIIEDRLAVNKDVQTLLDLKVLKAASFLIKGQVDSCVMLTNDVLHSPNSSAIQMTKAYQYNAFGHGKLGNKQYQYNSLINGLYYAKKTNNFNLISSFYNGLGTYHFTFSDKSKSHWKALYFFKKALQNCPLKNKNSRVIYLINLGNCYSKLNLQERSLSVLNEVYSNYTSILNAEQFFDVTMSLGTSYMLKGNLEKSEFFYQKAFDSLDDLPNITASDVNIYLNLSELELMKGNISKSRSYLRTYVTLYEKYLAKENSSKIIEMQERYNAKARNAQILEWKNKHQKAKLDKYFLELVLLVSAVVLAILAGIFFYYLRKKSIAEKLRVKNEIKKAALEATENEKLRFSRDLHDSLGGSLTVVSLLVSQAQERNPDQKTEFENLYQLVQSSITDLRRVCRDLFPSEILISGVISSIGFYYEKLAALHPAVKFEFTSEDMKLEKGFSVNIYRIVQELTNNSLKYAEATRIEANMLVKNGRMEFTYSDNGKGADQRALRKGVGLNSIEERTKAYKGSFQLETTTGDGFTVMLNFPVNDILINE